MSLEAPVTIAAFEGWNDAGDAASDALRFLARSLHAREVGTVGPDDYVDFQASRPHVEIVQGVTRSITWPRTSLLAGAQHDVLLVLGTEPSFGWRSYCDEILSAARSVGTRLVVTLGALLGDSPHSRSIPVTGTATDEELVHDVGLQRSRYEGPTGIVGALHAACSEAGMPSASLWAPVPHYAGTPPCPKATQALLSRLQRLVAFELDLSRLAVAARAWERQVDALVRGDEEVARYVQSLEARYDSTATDEPGAEPAPEPDAGAGDAIADDFQRWLRERDDSD